MTVSGVFLAIKHCPCKAHVNMKFGESVHLIRRLRRLCDGSTNPRLEPWCGRPLGIKFNPVTCDLYIADAYFGLMKVGPNGGPAQLLASSAEGIPFRFTNALDIDPTTGVVYFTDSSMYFQRRLFSFLNSCSSQF